jgi:hypothetical protein
VAGKLIRKSNCLQVRCSDCLCREETLSRIRAETALGPGTDLLIFAKKILI